MHAESESWPGQVVHARTSTAAQEMLDDES